jgi:hypothetical protein
MGNLLLREFAVDRQAVMKTSKIEKMDQLFFFKNQQYAHKWRVRIVEKFTIKLPDYDKKFHSQYYYFLLHI